MKDLDYTQKSVIAIGTFDGVHLGHRHLIQQAQAYHDRIARSYQTSLDYDGLRCTAVTFDRHPASVIRPGLEPLRLTDLEQKIDFLLQTGVDNVCVIRFDKQKSHLEARDFIVEFLVKQLNATAVFVGENFRFGYQAAGDTQLLSKMAKEIGFYFQPVPLLVDKKLRTTISSTSIRTLITSGNIQEANRLLGHPHAVSANFVARRGNILIFSVSHKAAFPVTGSYLGRLKVVKHHNKYDEWEVSGVKDDYIYVQRADAIKELYIFENVEVYLRTSVTSGESIARIPKDNTKDDAIPITKENPHFVAPVTVEQLDFINSGVQIVELAGIGKKDIDFLQFKIFESGSGESKQASRYLIELESQIVEPT